MNLCFTNSVGVFLLLAANVSAFVPISVPSKTLLLTPLHATPPGWKQQHGESDAAFYKRMQAIASDPKAFEAMVLQQQQEGETTAHNTLPTTTSPRVPSDVGYSYTRSRNVNVPRAKEPETKPKGYQRVEDWEAEQKLKVKELSWEEKVQFDGQRHGNRFQQNEILRHHLHSY